MYPSPFLLTPPPREKKRGKKRKGGGSGQGPEITPLAHPPPPFLHCHDNLISFFLDLISAISVFLFLFLIFTGDGYAGAYA